MCQANTSMKIRQDAVKAALAASCFDVHYTPSETGYRTWGNGALNSRYAWTVAKDSQFRYGIITSTDLRIKRSIILVGKQSGGGFHVGG